MSAGRLHAVIRGLSDIGVVREENQDSLIIHEPTDPAVRSRKGSLVAIADGMGGLDDGSTASRLAIDTVLRSYYEHPGSPRESLESAVRDANRAIFQHAQAAEGRRLMGSTLTALVLLDDRASIAQVGDSRAYRYRNGTLEQLTRDHSLVRELADRGEIDELSAKYTFHRNVLTRGLGLRDEVAVDIYDLEQLRDGDTILLSSDGLHEQVDSDEMASCLERFESDLDSACRELVRVARERGGPDNITVAIARVWEEGGESVPGAASRTRKALGQEPATWLIPVAVFVSFAAGVLLTLAIDSRPPLSEDAYRSLRAEVNAALDSKPSPSAEEEGKRLRDHLERVRKALEEE